MNRSKSSVPWRYACVSLLAGSFVSSPCVAAMINQQNEPGTGLAATSPATAPSAMASSAMASQATAQTEAHVELETARAVERNAYAADRAEEYEKAADAMERAVRSNPNDTPLRKSLAYLYMAKSKKPDRAIHHLEFAATMSPDDAGAAYMLAEAYTKTNRLLDAIGVYSRLIEAHPDDVWSRVAIAKLLAREKRHAEEI